MQDINKKINPISILEKAELNHENGNFNDALNQYIWFFDKAIDINKDCLGAKYVRCLIGWHDLSKVYVPAYDKLLERKDYLYIQLKTYPKKNDYIDFIKICSHLDLILESIKLFKYFHKNNHPFAKEIFSDTMQYLCESKEFTLCETYIDNINKLYQKQLLLLDNLLRTDRQYYENEFSNTYIETFFRKIEYILESLKTTNRTVEINNILSMLKNDMTQRNIHIKIEN